MSRAEIAVGQADHYRVVLLQFWPKLGPRLLAAQSPEEIVRAIHEDAVGISGSLVPFSELILKILRDRKPYAVTHAATSSLYFTSRRSRINGGLGNRHSGLKKSWLKSTSGKGSTPTGSNCRTNR